LTDREHHALSQLDGRALHAGAGDERLDDPFEIDRPQAGPALVEMLLDLMTVR